MTSVKFDFKGSMVLITGGSRGIGLAISDAFIKSGAKVVNISKSQKKTMNSKMLKFVQMDITDLNSVEEWLSKFMNKNRVDILINNAGIYQRQKLLDISEREWEEIFSTNLKSLFFISKMVASHMRERKKGVIINASSFAALMPSVNAGIYGASKAAVSSLTKSMAAEWAPYGIRVNSYCPGVITTKMTRELISSKKGKLLESIAMQRFGNPKEVAQLVLFLCSDAASYITGANLEISGGKFIAQNQQDAV